jgi:predicted RNase H-like HicB family nuclease
MTDITLQHEDGTGYRADKVTAEYDGRTVDLDVETDGTVYARSETEAEALTEGHGGFFRVNDDEAQENNEEHEEDDGQDRPSYVLEDRSVDEVGEYVGRIEDAERLKELRRREAEGKDRKTAKQAIDSRIEEVKEDELEGEGE